MELSSSSADPATVDAFEADISAADFAFSTCSVVCPMLLIRVSEALDMSSAELASASTTLETVASNSPDIFAKRLLYVFWVSS
ncbi:SCO family protein [Thalassospira xiamenensis]|uniref:SCO family protein n=1 Tax=Thalassospira xiamenensis TaxID=220697 RepID=UPI003857E962